MNLFLNNFGNATYILKDIAEAIGFIFSIYFSIRMLIWKNRQRKVISSIKELYELVNNKPNYEWLISEKFHQITNIKMNSQNIKILLQDKNAIEIIYLLKKYKRVYDYKNGKLIFVNEFKNKLINIVETIIFFTSSSIFGIFFIFSSLVFAFSDSIQDKIIFGIYIVISSIYLIVFLNWKDDKTKANELMIQQITEKNK